MPKGGFRPGSGRKPNSGYYREKTVVRRIPLSVSAAFDTYIDSLKSGVSLCLKEVFLVQETSIRLPLFSNKVAAGAPFPADEDIDSYLDLSAQLISKPATTFFVRVSGESMVLAGINDGDILVVDRSIEAKNGSIVIAVLNSELTVKRLSLEGDKCYLKPENTSYEPIEVTAEMDFYIWGVVTSVIHQFVKL
ncbi:LexA family protein [Candidatus Paracaedibacter symbiosus]|uniref:LexA family protein n=1 Tax=Candidatus Paracaedibacter symbiosus TaxID=244582 RepID=UPI00050967F0|nr:LexA family transcriptional regulator [Candidatus Paracaedibacter symbiosus]